MFMSLGNRLLCFFPLNETWHQGLWWGSYTSSQLTVLVSSCPGTWWERHAELTYPQLLESCDTTATFASIIPENELKFSSVPTFCLCKSSLLVCTSSKAATSFPQFPLWFWGIIADTLLMSHHVSYVHHTQSKSCIFIPVEPSDSCSLTF